jgi:hypothetical protein
MGSFWSYFLDFFGLAWVMNGSEQQALPPMPRQATRKLS